MQDIRELQDKGMITKEFADGMQSAIDSAPNGFALRDAHRHIKDLQLFDYEEIRISENNKYVMTKNQRKRQRKAKRKARRAQRA